MPYVFAAGTNVVSVSYSGSAEVVPVASGVVAPVAVEVDAPAALPSPATQATGPADAAGVNDAAGAGARDVTATMAHTGGEARTLVAVGAVLLFAGVALLRVRRRAI